MGNIFILMAIFTIAMLLAYAIRDYARMRLPKPPKRRRKRRIKSYVMNQYGYDKLLSED